MIFRKHLHWFIYPLFILSCARQTSPTGGPKDTIPPILKGSVPIKEQTNYKSKEVELTFSEYIQLANPKEQIIVTPDIGKEYEIVSRKTKVIITFEKDLKDSTTYLINFRDAVQDLTEKNPAVNLKLAFSTGSYVDSLSIEGNVYDILKSTEVKDATVLLYQSDTFNIFKHKPVYLTKANQKGAYKIENLKGGKYFIYAIDDKNRNLIADSKTESFGFLSDTIDLKSNLQKVQIPLLRMDTRALKLSSSRPYNTYFNIKTSKGLAKYTITKPNDSIVSSFGEDRANIRIYNTFPDEDSVQIHFAASDSIDNKIDTTLYIKFAKRETTPEKFTATSEGFRLMERNGHLSGKVKFSKPLLQITYDSIHYTIDSLTRISFTPADFTWESGTNTLIIQKTIDKNLLIKKEDPNGESKRTAPAPRAPAEKSEGPKEKPKPAPVEYQLYMGPSSFISIELDSSGIFSEALRPQKFEETGIINIEVQTSQPYFIVELLDKNFTVLKSIKNQRKVSFEDLIPGDYQVRLIIDKDHNGSWSPGNFYKKQEPEPIHFYRNEKNVPSINLKANWEIGPLLIKHE